MQLLWNNLYCIKRYRNKRHLKCMTLCKQLLPDKDKCSLLSNFFIYLQNSVAIIFSLCVTCQSDFKCRCIALFWVDIWKLRLSKWQLLDIYGPEVIRDDELLKQQLQHSIWEERLWGWGYLTITCIFCYVQGFAFIHSGLLAYEKVLHL